MRAVVLSRLQDLLDAAGIHISDEDAGSCLECLPQNCQGRHNVVDFFSWLRNYRFAIRYPSSVKLERFNPPRKDIPPWRIIAWRCREMGLYCLENIRKCVDAMLKQSRVMQEIKRAKAMGKRECRRQMLTKKASLLGSSGFDEQDTRYICV